MANIQAFTERQNAALANVQVGDLVFVQKVVQPQYDDEFDQDDDYDDHDSEGEEQNEEDDNATEGDADDEIRSEDDQPEFESEESSESEDSSVDTGNTSSTSIVQAFLPTMYIVSAVTKTSDGTIEDLRMAPVTFAEKADGADGEHVFHIYGKEVLTHHSNSCACQGAKSIREIAVDDHFVFWATPNGDYVRRFIATNPSRRCIANCRDGWLNDVQELDGMIKDYDVPLLSWEGALPGYFMKPICPVCVGADLTKEQQDTQLMLLNIGPANAQDLMGAIVEFMGRLNPRRTHELGYRFEQFDERKWGFGAFDDMLSESDEEDDQGQFEHWDEAMDPSNNVPQRPASDTTIAELPRKTFGEVKLEHDDSDCMFCATEMKDSSPVIELPCGHAAFDEECITRWLKQYDSCPKCRAQVKTASSENEGTAKVPPMAALSPLSPGDSGDDFSLVNGAGMSGEAAMAAAIAASLAAEGLQSQADMDREDAIMSDE
ncbi:uncharacterized protein MYCFIDRAFT_195481 [Pseudocercospora fijiensis CIRAD86]|uniref:RING-type domain-containing protein n=1 Tax=Pseudocercospora fijiensis (strain CIRAD86) TaxID=383855 RepID=M2Z3N6_PSEFD|nr:uncharacterized protein MYCFIDRAFT_195481 [Pseudocercospora fijiensis CIRAD86]EME84430.1 hypothetical protein MYCFIDRAFT_195481 [Pseudocercospora fijiensis CIRAD86]